MQIITEATIIHILANNFIKNTLSKIPVFYVEI